MEKEKEEKTYSLPIYPLLIIEAEQITSILFLFSAFNHANQHK